jgi:Arc/MetJ-type ribon-helix-helix transcriptional regulator
MTVNLSKDLERFVHDAVRAGLYAAEDDVISDAVERLRKAESLDQAVAASMPRRQEQPARAALTEEEFKRQLVEAGVMTSLPTPSDPATRPAFQPIKIEGEPLSTIIIRERR